jgi:hypothetical protein
LPVLILARQSRTYRTVDVSPIIIEYLLCYSVTLP